MYWASNFIKSVEKKSWKVSLRKAGFLCFVTYIALPVSQYLMPFCETENQKHAVYYKKTLEDSILQASDLQDLTSISIVNVHGSSHCCMSSRKPFYDLLPIGNKQTSFMPMEASAFVNTKPRTCGQLLSHCHHSRDEIWQPEQNNNIFVTSQISTRLGPSRQQVSNPVSLLSMISVKSCLINTKLGDFVNLGVLFSTMWINSC